LVQFTRPSAPFCASSCHQQLEVKEVELRLDAAAVNDLLFGTNSVIETERTNGATGAVAIS
jgi:hypothetical protein